MRRGSRSLSTLIVVLGILISSGIGVLFYFKTELGTAFATFSGLLGTVLTLQVEASSRAMSARSVEEKLTVISESLDASPGALRSVISKRFDPDLYRLFPQHFNRLLDLVFESVDSSNATLTRKEEFPLYYANTLKSFPGQTFLATGFSDDGFLWESSSWRTAIEDFHRNGGKIKRIFFSDHDADGEIEAAVKSALSRQVALGAEVYVVPDRVIRSVYPHLYEMMLVDPNGKIMWKYDLAPGEIRGVQVTTDSEVIRQHIQIFENLRNLPETRQFSP